MTHRGAISPWRRCRFLARVRSVLFAPANQPSLVRKVPRSSPDAVVVDLEDSVPPESKELARSSALMLIGELVLAHPSLKVLLRINSPASPWFQADLEAACTLQGLSGIVVPKLEYRSQLEAVHLPVVVGIETARGAYDVRRLLGPPVVAAYFGAEDFISDLGGRRTVTGLEVLHARSEIALAARVAGVQALDQVVIDFRDDVRFRTEAASAVDMGYSGKLCIHPRQVPLANAAFTPTTDEVDRSKRLLELAEEMAMVGRGAFEFDGRMIDEPILRRARSIVERVRD